MASAIDPRVAALFRSLELWLPRDLAWDRAANAACALLLIETAPEPIDALDPREVIMSVLTNVSAMRGHTASGVPVDDAVAAWLAACPRPTTPPAPLAGARPGRSPAR